MQRLLAFDIETSKLLPDDVTDVLPYLPLGVACAVAVPDDRRRLAWVTQRGTVRQVPLPVGWLRVVDAQRLPFQIRRG